MGYNYRHHRELYKGEDGNYHHLISQLLAKALSWDPSVALEG